MIGQIPTLSLSPPHSQHSTIRTLLLLLNIATIVAASMAFMPLGQLQATYAQNCFLFTEVRVKQTNASAFREQHYFIFDRDMTVWGPKKDCNFVTFSIVSLDIFAIITGWNIIQLWPEMMADGTGGAMTLVLTLVYLGTGICSLFTYQTIRDGFEETCHSIQKIHKDHKFTREITCDDWKHQIRFPLSSDMDVIGSMYHAQDLSFILLIVEATKVLCCLCVYILDLNPVRNQLSTSYTSSDTDETMYHVGSKTGKL